MAKAPKKNPSNLMVALKFISAAQHKEGESYRKHCLLTGKWAQAFDGMLAVGHPIEDDITAQPRTDTLLMGLGKCGDNIKMTFVDNTIRLNSGSFRLTVPCDPVPLNMMPPDPPALNVGNSLLLALSIVSVLPEEGDERTVCRSVLLGPGGAMATYRGHAVMEAWHGLKLPFRHAIPIRSVKAIIGAKKAISSIGWSENSLTVWFEDNSFMKTMIDDGTWPDLNRMFDTGCDYKPIPEKLFEALDAVSDFTTDKRVRFREGRVQTHYHDGLGSAYDCPDLPFPVTYNADFLYHMEGIATEADFMRPLGCFWHGIVDGVKVRGAIAKLTEG